MADLISEHGRQNLARAFERAARETLIVDVNDQISIQDSEMLFHADPGQAILLITISSFTFRLLTIFQIAEAPALSAYYVRGAAGRSLQEAFAEVANMCCGAINRQLALTWPHLAMSIPQILDTRCLAFVNDLRPQYLSQYALSINEAVKLRATLCLCCSAPVEFAALASEAQESSGELELF
jgi:hypothetical protein